MWTVIFAVPSVTPLVHSIVPVMVAWVRFDDKSAVESMVTSFVTADATPVVHVEVAKSLPRRERRSCGENEEDQSDADSGRRSEPAHGIPPIG